MRKLFISFLVTLSVVLAVIACSPSNAPTILSVQPTTEPVAEEPNCNRVISGVSPVIEIISPVDNGEFEGQFAIRLTDFAYKPGEATDASTEFAIGKQEVNAGHFHGWVFNRDTNERVKFYGASGYMFEDGLYVRPETLEPGNYKAYFQLQNHDHTGVTPARAPDLPGIATVLFTVR